MMGHQGQFFRRGFGRSNVHVAEHQHGIPGNDLSVQDPGQGDAAVALAGGRRTDDGQDFRFVSSAAGHWAPSLPMIPYLIRLYFPPWISWAPRLFRKASSRSFTTTRGARRRAARIMEPSRDLW